VIQFSTVLRPLNLASLLALAAASPFDKMERQVGGGQCTGSEDCFPGDICVNGFVSPPIYLPNEGNWFNWEQCTTRGGKEKRQVGGGQYTGPEDYFPGDICVNSFVSCIAVESKR
jgi:hypothetical protein